MLYRDMLDEKRVIASKEGPLTDQEMKRLEYLNEKLSFFSSYQQEPWRSPLVDWTGTEEEWAERVATRTAMAMEIVKDIVAKFKAEQG